MDTRITDTGLSHLQGLEKLRELNLAFNEITDAGLKALEGIPSLRSLDLTRTKVTEDAVRRLRDARPDLTIEYKPGPGRIRPMVPAEATAPAPPGAPAPPPAKP